MSAPKPVALIIMDGFGLRGTTEGNAVAQANKPNYDRYLKQYPNTTLTACGEAVYSSGRANGQLRSRAFEYWCRVGSFIRI